jgi:hypothetical protein
LTPGCKLEVPSDVELIHIETPALLEILQYILGTTVSYRIRGRRGGRRATLKNNDLPIQNNETLNIVA